MKHTLQNTWKACASAILALVLSATMAHAQNARGTIVGTLGGEEVSWRVSSVSSGFWYLGEGEAVPSMGGNPWTAPDGVGAIAFSVDLSEGRDQQLVTLEIMSPDGDVLCRADEGGKPWTLDTLLKARTSICRRRCYHGRRFMIDGFGVR